MYATITREIKGKKIRYLIASNGRKGEGDFNCIQEKINCIQLYLIASNGVDWSESDWKRRN